MGRSLPALSQHVIAHSDLKDESRILSEHDSLLLEEFRRCWNIPEKRKLAKSPTSSVSSGKKRRTEETATWSGTSFSRPSAGQKIYENSVPTAEPVEKRLDQGGLPAKFFAKLDKLLDSQQTMWKCQCGHKIWKHDAETTRNALEKHLYSHFPQFKAFQCNMCKYRGENILLHCCVDQGLEHPDFTDYTDLRVEEEPKLLKLFENYPGTF